MPMKASGTADLTVIDQHDYGVGWLAYPNESMQRASHAVERDGDVWLIDPVDADGLDDLLAEYGEVAGVIVLLDRHKRDSAAIARRHDVAVHVPSWMSGVEEDIDAPVERFGDEIAGFEAERLVDNPAWQEAALFDGETLVVPEALGTVDYFTTSGERVGVHPMLRLLPPKSLTDYDPERLLVGHGEGLDEDVPEAIDSAISGSRIKTPQLYLKTAKSFLGF
ncbi:hypothetical protein HWV23_01705 [Natronomonas halophila]|uniref:hypothetical protein n=1 Tax=Natronomonas halophila TaxID=2747817 RepID=UPI0015B3FEC4|nr:hypothetical protein [Natronomonas halophila]QLD84474.1 hypothetical protein HWV23_01705 [Natronomonas halophila]